MFPDKTTYPPLIPYCMIPRPVLRHMVEVEDSVADELHALYWRKNSMGKSDPTTYVVPTETQVSQGCGGDSLAHSQSQ